MAKKTCLRKLCKYLPMSVESQVACVLDEQQEAGIPQQFAPEVPLELQPAPEPPEEDVVGEPAPHGATITCPWCGSANVIAVEWYGPTGVVAQDGGQEYQRQMGYRCFDCGELEA